MAKIEWLDGGTRGWDLEVMREEGEHTGFDVLQRPARFCMGLIRAARQNRLAARPCLWLDAPVSP
jgi:hypothetical protein